MSKTLKRGHAPPTGHTPGKTSSKRRTGLEKSKNSRKTLFQDDPKPAVKIIANEWKDKEVSALVEYVALYHLTNEDGSVTWPLHKREAFWTKCADAVNNRGDNNRTWNACRLKVKNSLRKHFNTISEAEEAYSISYIDGDEPDEIFDPNTSQSSSSGTPGHGLHTFCNLDFAELLPGDVLEGISQSAVLNINYLLTPRRPNTCLSERENCCKVFLQI